MSSLIWVGFVVVVLLLLALDLGALSRRRDELTTGEALGWSALWFALALGWNILVFVAYREHWLGVGVEFGRPLSGFEAATKFLTAYLLERSLSVDTIFGIAMVFAFLQVPPAEQQRVLFWSVAGAIVLRTGATIAGAALLHRVPAVSYGLGALLLVAAAKVTFTRHDNLRPERSVPLRLLQRGRSVTDDFERSRFFVVRDGRRHATPLFLALVLTQSMAAWFALAAIPAALAITIDPFLVVTSNVFAMLGLRAMYFALAGLMGLFRYMKLGLVGVLSFVALKMILLQRVAIAPLLSLAIVSGFLVVGAIAAIAFGPSDPERLESPLGAERERLAALTLRAARRVLVLMGGSTLLVVGLALLFLPGPGLPLLLAALALLATEFVWARRFLQRVKQMLRPGRSKEPPAR